MCNYLQTGTQPGRMSLSPGHLGSEGCFLVQSAASPVAARPSSPVKSQSTQRPVSATFSMSLKANTATSSVPHPRTASAGCDEPTRGPHQLTSLCKTGRPAGGPKEAFAHDHQPAEGKEKSGCTFADEVTAKKQRAGERGRDAHRGPPAAHVVGGGGGLFPRGWRMLTPNWMKGDRKLPGVQQDAGSTKSFLHS